jgi:hypothetical protein
MGALSLAPLQQQSQTFEPVFALASRPSLQPLRRAEQAARGLPGGLAGAGDGTRWRGEKSAFKILILTPCTDHIVAWKVRFLLNLDNVPAGVSATGDDNIIHDTTSDPVTEHTVSAGEFGHPTCDATATAVAGNLPTTHLVGAVAARLC